MKREELEQGLTETATKAILLAVEAVVAHVEPTDYDSHRVNEILSKHSLVCDIGPMAAAIFKELRITSHCLERDEFEGSGGSHG